MAIWIAGSLAAEGPVREPVRLIFDTDIGNDVDDAMALAVIHALADRGECQLLAVTVTKDNPYAGPMVSLLNTFYGRPEVPIGVVRSGKTPDDGRYLRQLVTAEDEGKPRYPHQLTNPQSAPEATQLLRRILASQPDSTVVMVQVGFSTNLARLLDSPPDALSPLDGKALVEKKVRLLSVMAGAFSEDLQHRRFREFNVVTDVPSAKKLFSQWPTPIVASGFEIGRAIQYPALSIRQDYRYVAHHPLAEAYRYYRGLDHDQPTYDLTSVLYAVRPDRGYFDLSPPGWIRVEDDGFTRFEPAPNGRHRYLVVNQAQILRVQEAFCFLCSQPPRTLRPASTH
ncbi:MAG: nucleoside hydrolase [Thermoguttaceae bacterium]|nr:nucleoside hydrolase [Thermoguttaceae bacterium]